MELKMVYAVTLFLAQVYYTILIDPPNLNQNKYTWQTYSLNQTNTSVLWSNLFPFSKNTVELALTWTNKSYTSMEIKTVLIDEKNTIWITYNYSGGPTDMLLGYL